jgi:threonine 3-dehydrogenase
MGIDRHGGLAEFVSVPECNCWPVHKDIGDKAAAVMDPCGNAVHTVTKADVSGKTVLVTGAGSIGLTSIQVALAFGASEVFAADVHEGRLERAHKLGAKMTFSTKDKEWVKKVRDATEGYGVDVVLEMSGAPACHEGVREAVRRGGTIAQLGIYPGTVESDHNCLTFKQVDVRHIAGREIWNTWQQTERLLVRREIDPDVIITHVLSMYEYERAFELMESGDAIKVLLSTINA